MADLKISSELVETIRGSRPRIYRAQGQLMVLLSNGESIPFETYDFENLLILEELIALGNYSGAAKFIHDYAEGKI